MSTVATPVAVAATPHESLLQKVEGVIEGTEKKVVTFMEWLGTKTAAAIADIEPYLPEAATLASILFPAGVSTTTAAVSAVQAIQQIVVAAKQKWDAVDHTGESSAQMLADELSLANTIVPAFLAQLNITWSTAQIEAAITAVVNILKLQPAPTVA